MAAVPAAGRCPQPGSAQCSLQHSQAPPSLPLHWHLCSGGAFRATAWWGTGQCSALSLQPRPQPQGLPSPPEEAALCQHWVPALTALPVALPCQAGAAVCSEPCEHTHTRCPAAPGLLAELTWVPEPGQAQQCLLPRTLLPTWGTPRGSRGKSHSQVFTARPHSGPLVSSLLPPSPPPAAPRTEIVPG